MEKFLKLFGLCLALMSYKAQAAQTIDTQIKIGQSTIHYGVYEAEAERKGDVLYFHGFGDRFQNHEALFAEFNAAGFRVIGFDLPSHGDSMGTAIGGIDFHSFESLSEIAEVVLSSVRNSTDKRPLFFAGWSLGGLLATRILQVEAMREQFPTVSGLIVYAPAVSPKKCVGNLSCKITNETLSHNPDLLGREIKPDSPLLHLPFSARLIVNSVLSWQPPLPADLQTLVLLADDNDSYVHTPLVVNWVGTHRSNYISRISAYKCPGARHELDNEPAEYSGDFVRKVSTDFAMQVAQGERWEEKAGFANLFRKPCAPF